MAKLINTTTLTVDGVTDVGEWSAGLVDELRFWVHPAVWGGGARPYQGARVAMRLLESRSFDSGVTLLRYEPVAR
jgi:hypothetical protein